MSLHTLLHISFARPYIARMSAVEDPLVDPAPVEVPLKRAPLVRVIAQIRFPLVVAVEQPDFIAPFQKSVQQEYPVLRQEQAQGVVLGPTGVSQVPPQTAWRFADVEGHWRVSLTQNFLALETTKYTSRSDFLARLSEVVAPLDVLIQPKLLDRIGLRYIDRISGPDLRDIADLVRPEVRGIAGSPAASHAVHALSESLFEIDGARVLGRWGRLPAGGTVDPAALEPIDEPCWILDLDMFSSNSMPFSSDRVLSDASRFAERIYTLFRWAVTPAFLHRYGGQP
jgi:uncharacterized protein (TIGR04255 family)